MGKIRLYSIQNKNHLLSILSGSYIPKLELGYGGDDKASYDAYICMLDLLKEKTDSKKVPKDRSCIWAWYQKPYLKNHKNLRDVNKELVVVTFDIDEEEVLLSYFDKWCDKFNNEIDNDFVVKDRKKLRGTECIQAVVWSIPVEGIVMVEDFRSFAVRCTNSAVA